MGVLFAFLAFFAFAAVFVFGILSIVFFARKEKSKGKKQLLFAGGSFAVFIISFIAFGATLSGDETEKKIEVASDEKPIVKDEEKKEPEMSEEEKAEQKKAEENAAADAKAKEEAEAKALAEAEAKAKAEAEAKEESIPREHKAALKKAETYAEMMHMSKAGIYDQLTSEYGENFPKEAAQYAIDNIVWDWKENALKKAETYAEMMSMSDSAIYEQLISEYGEKFTKEEAQYAVDNLK
ncbi:Ltp family lipoprotein [Sporosarcina koreensis]|uniref:Ltp family lipoprotein n=1 Tax=Sporosarcina koreensis TaxID=334735 RepID=UPI0009EACFA7